ncbi:MAG: penicillin-binding protein, partial [Propionibacteriaceae bacterium]|nr:penicillin-binding protein [Propionibacteriaceae bacterium]
MAKKSTTSVGARMFGFLCFSIIAGLLTAGLAVPVVAMVSGVASAAAEDMTTMPLNLDIPVASEETQILAADGSLIGTIADQNRTWVDFDDIAPIMRQAIVAIEDHRFYQHGALDLEGLMRAIVVDALGGDMQGASSITQQYVKLVRSQTAWDSGDKDAYDAAIASTLDRKIMELRYAVGVEQVRTKDQILEGYLNLAYFGDGAYGVEAAANHFFGVHASELTLSQAAMLAGLVQNPGLTDPISNEKAAIARRNVVLDRMAHPEVAMITTAQAAAAKAEPFDQTKVVPFNVGCAQSRYPFICDYIEHIFASEQMEEYGETPESRLTFLRRGGLTIHTSIDPAAMDTAIASLMERAAPTDPVVAVSATVEAGTGRIIQMAQSRPVMGVNAEAGETFFNYAVDYAMGGAEGFQAGSSFKPFTLAAALEQGASLSHYYDAPRRMDFSKDSFKACDGTFRVPWTVGNFGGSEYGQITLLRATIDSVNTYYGQLIRDVGVCQTVGLAKRAGIHAAIAHPSTGGTDLIDDYHFDHAPSFTLGSAEVAPLVVAEAYATFAGRGTHCSPIIMDAIEDRDGKQLNVPSANCQEVMNPEVADGVSQVLSQVMYGGGAADGRVSGPWPQAGKTGTTDSAQAFWLMGYTRQYATA